MRPKSLALALVVLGGCRTRTEEIVCASDADCSKTYYCDVGRERCLLRVCESDADCIEEMHCDLAAMRCVEDNLPDGGGDGPTTCD